MRLLSPRELADALGVSESSLKRWVDAGKIVAARTEGGHRRISVPEAVRFIRETGAPLARPELLGMPEVGVAHERGFTADALATCLMRGDAVGARGYLMARYLAGASIAELSDGPVRDAMHRLGELWRHDGDGVFIEHRATDACLQALAHFRNMIEPPSNAPVAVGATPEDDPYILPTFIAAMVVASAGMTAVNLGPDTPVSALARAFETHHPALVWVSVSAPLPPARAREIDRWFASLPATTTIVVGGRNCEPIAHRVRRVESMTELAAVAREVVARVRS